MEAVESSAVRIALKLHMRGYASEEKAVAALRRKHKGMSKGEALELLRLAGAVLNAAIAFIKPSMINSGGASVAGTKPGQGTIPDIDERFRVVAPKCSEAMRNSAITWAQFYHSR